MEKQNNFEINKDFQRQAAEKHQRDIEREQAEDERRRQLQLQVQTEQENQIRERQNRDKGMTKEEFDLNLTLIKDLTQKRDRYERTIKEMSP